MLAHDVPSLAGRVIVLLCSSLAAARGDPYRPLGPAAWAGVSRRLEELHAVPEDLLRPAEAGIDPADELLAGLDLDLDGVRRQLSRSGQLAFELDRLATRGIACVTIADDAYPGRLRERLADKAPPVLFTAGDLSILADGGVAVVGSRDVDAAGDLFAGSLATEAARAGRVLVSGGARGVDQIAMAAALERGGRVAGLLPEGIERRLRERATRAAVADGQVALASPYHPSAPFSAGAAMGRNRLIYALADFAVVVSSAAGSGGTWAGATEALKAGWAPVFVRSGDGTPEGNDQLQRLGARPLSEPLLPSDRDLQRPVEAPAGVQRVAESRPPYEQTTLDL